MQEQMMRVYTDRHIQKLVSAGLSAKSLTEISRRLVAYHEAGQAVAHYCVGVPFQWAVVETGPHAVMGVTYTREYDGASLAQLHKELIILHAGHIAECVSGLRPWHLASEADRYYIEKYIDLAGLEIERRRAVLLHSQCDAVELITTPIVADAIKAAARVLCDRGRLGFDEVGKIVQYGG